MAERKSIQPVAMSPCHSPRLMVIIGLSNQVDDTTLEGPLTPRVDE